MTSQAREIYWKFRPNGSAQSITVSAANNTQIGAFKRIKFRLFTCPISFYAVGPNNKQFYFTERLTIALVVTDVSVLLNLTEGNYTISSFATEVSTIINANNHATTSYTVTTSTTTGKLTIVGSGDGTYQGFQIEFYSGVSGTTSSPSKRLQAEKIWGVAPTTLTSTVTVTQIGSGSFLTTYVSTNPISLWGPDQLLVISPELKKLMTKYNTEIVDAQSNIIMRVPITTSAFSQQTYVNTDSEITGVNNQTIPTTVTLDVIDETGNSINFNGGTCYLHMIVL